MTHPSRLAAAANDALAFAWRRGLSRYPSLDVDRLIAKARGAERSGDFGPSEHWREPLRLLLAELESVADLNPLGRTIAHGQIVRLLADRLGAARLWRGRPDMLATPIAAPVVILGQMRSGTTRLHRLLACDSRFAATRAFESMSPVPRARPRPLRTAATLRLLHALNPALAAIHPTGAWQPEEEFGLLAFSFCGAQFEAQWRVPGFTRYWEQADRAPVYADLHRLLQTIRWSRREDPAKPWLLKAPQFMEDLAALLATFPDARLLCLSRDRDAVAGSSASLVWQQMRLQSDSADRHWIGREWMRKIVRREAIAAEVRAANPNVPQLALSHEAIDRDWRGEVRRIYEFLGMPLDDALLARMQRYLERPHQSHPYRLDEFGLIPQQSA